MTQQLVTQQETQQLPYEVKATIYAGGDLRLAAETLGKTLEEMRELTLGYRDLILAAAWYEFDLEMIQDLRDSFADMSDDLKLRFAELRLNRQRPDGVTVNVGDNRQQLMLRVMDEDGSDFRA